MKDDFNFPKKSSIRSAIISILFSLLFISIFIGVLEIVLRTTHLFGARISGVKPDSLLGWRFIPGHKHRSGKENNHPVSSRINSYGWRDKEWRLRKPKNTYRIAVLGDSYVEAFQVESDRTFMTLVEHQLNKNHNLKVELMNFGRSGFTQTEELIVLKNDVSQFSPDMVVLFFLPENDIRDVNRLTAIDLNNRPYYCISDSGKLILDKSFVETREFKIRSFVSGLKQHSALISLLAQRYTAYRKQMQARQKNITITREIPKEINGYLSLCTATSDAIYLENYQLNKLLIKAMSEYCEERGVQFMLVTIDNPSYIPEIEKKFKSIDSTFNPNFFEDDLKAYARLLNIEYLGLQRIFRKSYENNGIALHWFHWNYEGHIVVAGALSNTLESIIYSKE